MTADQLFGAESATFCPETSPALIHETYLCIRPTTQHDLRPPMHEPHMPLHPAAACSCGSAPDA